MGASLIRFVRLFPERIIRTATLRVGLIRRAMTLGVRVLVEDGKGRILLVRHTYIPGWHLPGGGLDLGESAEAAAVRELREEAGLIATARPALAGLYRNTAAAGRDHVALFVVRDFTVEAGASPDPEIAEAHFFARQDMPPETTQSTRDRLSEIFDGKPPAETW